MSWNGLGWAGWVAAGWNEVNWESDERGDRDGRLWEGMGSEWDGIGRGGVELDCNDMMRWDGTGLDGRVDGMG